MQLRIDTARHSRISTCGIPARCPHCGDPMVAPFMSEFVEGDEIRHHWECDACGGASSTSIPLTTH